MTRDTGFMVVVGVGVGLGRSSGKGGEGGGQWGEHVAFQVFFESFER